MAIALFGVQLIYTKCICDKRSHLYFVIIVLYFYSSTEIRFFSKFSKIVDVVINLHAGQ